MARKNKRELIKLAVKSYKAKLFMETIEVCEQALALDPNCITPYYGIGKSLVYLHKYQEALVIYNKALEVKETKELYTQRGHLSFLLEDYGCASNDYYRALIMDPNARKYKYYEAVEVHSKALELKETKELYAQRGDLHHMMQDYVSASNDYYRALVLDPKDEELKKKKDELFEKVRDTPYGSDIIKDDMGFTSIEWDYEKEEMEEDYYGYMRDWEVYTLDLRDSIFD